LNDSLPWLGVEGVLNHRVDFEWILKTSDVSFFFKLKKELRSETFQIEFQVLVGLKHSLTRGLEIGNTVLHSNMSA
jgi:hypothetical protein